MTAINLALATDRALIVCDELISGGGPPLAMSKVMPFPHLRLCAAVAGHHLIALELAVYFGSGSLVGRDVHDVVAELPDVLRAAWDHRRLTAPTSAYVVGITAADELAAFRLDSSAAFEPRRLTSGVWLSPGFKPDAATTETPPAERAETARETTPAPPAAWAWHEATQAAVDAVTRQHREHPASIGGRVQTCLITADSIFQSWRDLPGLT